MTITLTGLLGDIADAIRGKDGTTAEIAAADFPDRIAAIQTGGSEPSSGQMYALVYSDGFTSVQYGDEAYDSVSHGDVADTLAFDPPAADTGIYSYSWPWDPIKTSVAVTAVVFRHAMTLMYARHMFSDLSSLAYADMGKVDMSGCVRTDYMFYGCSNLCYVYGTGGWDLGEVTTASYMFSGCGDLLSVDCGGWGLGSLTDSSYMFDGCGSLSSLDVSGWLLPNVSTAGHMFYNCKLVSALDVSGWRPSALTDMDGMFYGCYKVPTLDLSGWGCAPTSLASAFGSCNALSVLDLSGLDTSSCTSMSYMLYSCSSLKSVDLSVLDVSACTTMANMLCSCSGLTVLDLSTWDTSSVANMSSMFSSCSKLFAIFVGSGWSTASVTSSSGMFSYCSKLAGGNGTSYSSSHATADYAVVDADGTPGYLRLKPADSEMPYALLYSDGHLSLQVGKDPDTEAHGEVVASYMAWSMGAYDYQGTPWYGRVKEIKSVAACAGAKPRELSYLFFGASNLETADLHLMDVSSCTTALAMMSSCSSLSSCDAHGWDVSNLKTLTNMFGSCSSLKTLDLDGWSTCAPTAMAGFVKDSVALEELDLSWLDTTSVTVSSSDFSGLKLKRLVAGALLSFTKSSIRPGSESGVWYSSDGTCYDPRYLPNLTAATYTSTKPDTSA